MTHSCQPSIPRWQQAKGQSPSRAHRHYLRPLVAPKLRALRRQGPGARPRSIMHRDDFQVGLVVSPNRPLRCRSSCRVMVSPRQHGVLRPHSIHSHSEEMHIAMNSLSSTPEDMESICVLFLKCILVTVQYWPILTAGCFCNGGVTCILVHENGSNADQNDSKTENKEFLKISF